MKKNLIKGMAALCVCALFASCSKDPGYEVASNPAELAKNEYKANFIKKYGEIDPNQSWDFSNCGSAAQARTRAGESEEPYVELGGGLKWRRIYPINGFWDFIDVDKEEVMSKVYSVGTSNWNPNIDVELYPCYAHGKSEQGLIYQYYHLGICKKGQTYTYKDTQSDIEIPGAIRVKYANWYGAGNSLIHDSGREILAETISDANAYWVAYTTYGGSTASQSKYQKSKDVVSNISAWEIKKFKEFVVNGHTYWCFDCNGDQDYSDLICLARILPKPIMKRYLVEDLGATDDFDFNDIVVDVYQDIDGKQSAIVRAMGGTLDFTLKIGNTEWSKSGKGFDITTMYNTKRPNVNWEESYDEFDVDGWVPASNNIEVSVIVKEDKVNESGAGNVIIKIPFPRQGEVPMIIAMDPIANWNYEWDELRSDWWTRPTSTFGDTDPEEE